MATRLSDGIPVTTEWLNGLVEEINAIKNSIPSSSTGSAAASKIIEFIGPGLQGSSSIQVLTGVINGLSTAKADVFEADVNFSVPFADKNVFIVCTPTFPSVGTRKGKPSKAAASVCAITDSSFKLTVMLVDDDDQFTGSKQVSINYIAIGKKK
jgi:hypothetical protein